MTGEKRRGARVPDWLRLIIGLVILTPIAFAAIIYFLLFLFMFLGGLGPNP